MTESPAKISLRLRVDLGDEHLLGPGKIGLLEKIDETGSISAAGRALDMSYSRAWNLINELNRTFKKPMVEAQVGGEKGGGAKLTKVGAGLVRLYRSMERQATGATSSDMRMLIKLLS